MRFQVGWIKRLYRAWLRVAHALGTVNAAILLTIFYFSFLGIAKLVTVITKKDLLDSSWRDRESYWKKRTDFPPDPALFLKPY